MLGVVVQLASYAKPVPASELYRGPRALLRCRVRTSTHTHAILPAYADILNADRRGDVYLSASLYCRKVPKRVN